MCSLNCFKMALDLKVEIFAYALFYEAWTRLGIVENKSKVVTKSEILQIFGEECYKVENCMEVRDILLSFAVFCRRKVFGRIYMADFSDENAISLKSLCDCYNYIISTCDRDDLFGHLTVFERMFATCAFAIEFCIQIHQYNIVDVLKYGHKFWAMYFDKFTEEFYEEGGWEELKQVATRYARFYDIVLYIDVSKFHILGKAIEDYYDFMDNDQYEDCKYNLKKIHVSKLWIKYRVERFENCIKIPLRYQHFIDASDVDELLENLKCLFECLSKTNSIVIDLASSDTFDEYDAYLDNLNAQEVLSTNQMAESLCYRKSPPCNISDKTKICSEKGDIKRCVEEEEFTERILEVNCSLKNDDRKEIAMRTDIISTSQIAKSELNGNSFSCIPPTQVTDNLCSGNTEMQRETAPETLSKNHMDVSICYRKRPPFSVPDTTNFSSKKSPKGSVEEVSNDKTLVVSCTSRNGDETMENLMTTEIMSSSPMAETESTYNLSSGNPESKCEIPTSLEVLSTNLKDISLCYSKSPPYSDSDTPNFSSEKVKNSFENVRIEKTFEVNSSKNRDQQLEIAKRTEIVSTSHMAKSELYGNFQHIPIQYKDNLYSGNTERLSETPETLSKNQKDISCYWKTPSYGVPDTMNCSSEKEGRSEEVRIEKSFEVNCRSRNEDDYWEIGKRMEVISISQMAKSDLDVKTSPDIVPILKVSKENKSENTDDFMETNEKPREDLLNEQDDHNIKIFLRMILVLSDRQGTKFVFQALENNLDGPKKARVTEKKPKKKYK